MGKRESVYGNEDRKTEEGCFVQSSLFRCTVLDIFNLHRIFLLAVFFSRCKLFSLGENRKRRRMSVQPCSVTTDFPIFFTNGGRGGRGRGRGGVGEGEGEGVGEESDFQVRFRKK